MSMEDLTLRQITEAMELIIPISESIVKHSLVILGDHNHSCEGEPSDDDFDDLPDFTDSDVKAFLAFEDSAIAMLGFMREALIAAGYTELTKEVV